VERVYGDSLVSATRHLKHSDPGITLAVYLTTAIRRKVRLTSGEPAGAAAPPGAARLFNLLQICSKQLSNVALVGQWPRHFHPIAMSRNWCPEWRARPWLE
jgi:hypothetical protein